MKRFFTLLFAVVMIAMSAMATDYTDKLVVEFAGTTEQTATISVNKQENGKYKFELKDFSFQNKKVGDIVLDDVEGTEQDGIITLSVTNKTIKIQNPGSYGNLINGTGGVNLTMTAKISTSANKMYATMNMTAMGLLQIKATFGDEKNITTGINTPQNATKAINSTTIYTLDGQQVSNMTSGQVYIIKTTDGKTKKVIKK